MPQKIGVVGIGIMGQRMCRNLVKAGFPVVAHDLSPTAGSTGRRVGCGLRGRPPLLGPPGGRRPLELARSPAGPRGDRGSARSARAPPARRPSLRRQHRGPRHLSQGLRGGPRQRDPCPGLPGERRPHRRRGRNADHHGRRRRGGAGGGAAGPRGHREEGRPLRPPGRRPGGQAGQPGAGGDSHGVGVRGAPGGPQARPGSGHDGVDPAHQFRRHMAPGESSPRSRPWPGISNPASRSTCSSRI